MSHSVTWVLIEGRTEQDPTGCRALLRAAGPRETAEYPVPVLPNGRIHELVEVPGSATQFDCWLQWGDVGCSLPAAIRPVSVFERTWRMANRVFGCFTRMGRAERLALGLTAWSALFRLPSAYRLATRPRFRVEYQDWLQWCDHLSPADLFRARAQAGSLLGQTRFVVMVSHCGEDPVALSRTLKSLDEQVLPPARRILVGAGGEPVPDVTASGAEAQSSWLLWLEAGDVLSPVALLWLAHEAARRPAATLIFTDDDELDASGRRCQPRFKPDWSLEHFRATDFIGRSFAVRLSALGSDAPARWPASGAYGSLLRVVEALQGRPEAAPAHVPAVLFHRRPAPPAGPDRLEAERAEVAAHLARAGVDGSVETVGPGLRRVRYRATGEAGCVSIIVPTRDALAMLRRCVESVLQRTDWPQLELIVVDNRSRDPAALEYLDSLHGLSTARAVVRVLRHDAPFNYSAINNRAVAQATGELVCLLNNDTEVIAPDWLREMAGHLAQPGVGVVGAKLLYPDGQVQHAGDVVGPGGCANHLHARIGRDDPGYCSRALVAQELSAVTAACLLTRRDVYRAVGGLDQRWLRVAFNDVDFCLKVRRQGLRVVWTPHALLYHHESVSRGTDRGWRRTLRAESEVFVMRRRWRREMSNDPFYNPNLSYARPDFSPAFARRVKRPWEV